jgi:hypothetical protein
MATPSIQRPGKYTDDLAQAALATEDPVSPNEAADKEETTTETQRLSPMERWRNAIESANLTEDEADKILDAVLTNGFYDKTFKIFRGKLTITLRSRDSASLQRVSDALDTVRTNDVRVHTQTMNRYNLAASLVRYQDKTFKHPPLTADANDRDRAFVERLNFVDTIPAPVLVQMYAVLAKFDNTIFAALSEGAEMGF